LIKVWRRNCFEFSHFS